MLIMPTNTAWASRVFCFHERRHPHLVLQTRSPGVMFQSIAFLSVLPPKHLSAPPFSSLSTTAMSALAAIIFRIVYYNSLLIGFFIFTLTP